MATIQESMDKELIFRGRPMRMMFCDGHPMMVLHDIARAIGYRKENLTRVVKNSNVLKKYMGSVIAPIKIGKGGIVNRKVLCLSKHGVMGLLIKLESSRIRDPEKRAKIEKFQHWAITTLRKVMDGEIVPQDTAPVPQTQSHANPDYLTGRFQTSWM